LITDIMIYASMLIQRGWRIIDLTVILT